jgi:hypothetical protein
MARGEPEAIDAYQFANLCARGRGCAIVIIDAACFSLGSWCMLSGGRQGEVAAPELLTIRPPCKAHSIGSAPK